MKKNQFVHLHVHSDYSLLDGMCKIREIANLAEEYKMPAVALTDYDAMGGGLEFYNILRVYGVKPIIGCEFRLDPTSNIILLAKDYSGYQNLCRIMNRKEERVNDNILSKYSDGLLALSGIGTDISMQDAESALQKQLNIFGPDNLYLALTDHGQVSRSKKNLELLAIVEKLNIKPVATNDVRFLSKEDYSAFPILQCLKNNITLKEYKPDPSMEQHYFKTADEMAAVFADIPEAVSNTLEVAEKCNIEIPLVPYNNHYPVYEIQSDISRKEYLRNICIKGIKERYGFNAASGGPFDQKQQEIIDRMDFEFHVIDIEHYCSYFLIVWDIVKFAKGKGIPVGPGRGAVGGSLVCYLAGITDIDPIQYNLVFERFFNPDRLSPPDIDLDICAIRRKEVMEYVREKYGNDKTAYLSKYKHLKGRFLIKAILRALGRKPSDWLEITKHISGDLWGWRIGNIVDENPALREFIKKEPWAKEVYDYAVQFKGVKESRAIHASGIIIGDEPLENIVPLYKNDKGRKILQYMTGEGIYTGWEILDFIGSCSMEKTNRIFERMGEKYQCAGSEDLGVLQLNFPGLRTLSKIQKTLRRIEKETGKIIDIRKIPLDDEKTFGLLNKGDTHGVFQLGSLEMQELCPKLGIERIEDIFALIAIYKPGTMQFISEFITRKKGEIPIEYEDPRMEPILRETYGMILYQEQMIQLIQILTGFSAGDADLFRRAMGKKKIKEVEFWLEKFLEDCKSNGIDKETADEFFEKIAKFAGFGFIKSHAAGYALVAYRTAYLKAHYRNEFTEAFSINSGKREIT